MTAEQKNEIINKLRAAVGDLAQELAKMHGTLMNVIMALNATKLSEAQRQILDAAKTELKTSQCHFFATYADTEQKNEIINKNNG